MKTSEKLKQKALKVLKSKGAVAQRKIKRALDALPLEIAKALEKETEWERKVKARQKLRKLKRRKQKKLQDSDADSDEDDEDDDGEYISE